MIAVISQNLESKPRKGKIAPKKNSEVKNLTSSKINVLSKKVVLKKKIATKKAKAKVAVKKTMGAKKLTPVEVEKPAKAVKTKRTRAKKALNIEVTELKTPEIVAEQPARTPEPKVIPFNIIEKALSEDLKAIPLLLEENPVVESEYFEPVPSPIIPSSIQISSQEPIEHSEHEAQTAVIEKIEVATAPEVVAIEEEITYTEPVESIFTELEQILSKEPVAAPTPIAPKVHILKRVMFGFLAIFRKFAKRMPASE
jgi:hypothetical protein